MNDFPPVLDAIGQRLAQRLLATTQEIDPVALQQLRAVREQAVDQRRLVLARQAQTSLQLAAQTREASSRLDSPSFLWQKLGGVAVLLALVIGLWQIDETQSDRFTQSAAEIDKQLLTDELPPAAYLDPGFKHFLKLSFSPDPQ